MWHDYGTWRDSTLHIVDRISLHEVIISFLKVTLHSKTLKKFLTSSEKTETKRKKKNKTVLQHRKIELLTSDAEFGFQSNSGGAM